MVVLQCLGEGDLASIYGLDLADGVTKDQFISLCPALIQQKIGGYCEVAETIEKVHTQIPPIEGNKSQLAEPSSRRTTGTAGLLVL